LVGTFGPFGDKADGAVASRRGALRKDVCCTTPTAWFQGLCPLFLRICEVPNQAGQGQADTRLLKDSREQMRCEGSRAVARFEISSGISGIVVHYDGGQPSKCTRVVIGPKGAPAYRKTVQHRLRTTGRLVGRQGSEPGSNRDVWFGGGRFA